MTLASLRQEVCEANRTLAQQGLVMSGLGSVTRIDRAAGRIVCTPAKADFDRLMPDQMLVLDEAGQVIEGQGEPGLEVVAHVALYREFPHIGAVANTYGPYATMFAQAERGIPCLGVVHARYFKGEIPVTRMLRKPEVERQYGKSLASVIVERFARMDSREMPAVLVARHGAFVWANTVADVVRTAETVERVAQMAWGIRLLAPQAEPMPVMLIEKHFG